MAPTPSQALLSKIEKSISLFNEMQKFIRATDEAGLRLQELQESAGTAKDSIYELPYEPDLRGYGVDRYGYAEMAGKYLLRVQAYAHVHLLQYYTLKGEPSASLEAEEVAQELEFKRRSSLEGLSQCEFALKNLHTLLDNVKGVADQRDVEEAIKELTDNYSKHK